VPSEKRLRQGENRERGRNEPYPPDAPDEPWEKDPGPAINNASLVKKHVKPTAYTKDFIKGRHFPQVPTTTNKIEYVRRSDHGY
jgi:hypothetical protein